LPEDLDTNDDDTQTDDSPVIRDLREKAKRTDTAEAKAVAVERELTLHKAGLGTLSPMQQKALSAAHEGDWDPELLKATATELGFVQTEGSQQPTPEPKVPAGELDAMQRVAQAAGGQPTPPPDLTAAIEAAQTPEEIKTILRNAEMLAE